MESLVSIIVPVYNLEEYIGNCLDSLVGQTYKNIEVLCIDDGSTDAGPSIIKSFCDKDERIRYIRKENGGVSSARNSGLDIFKGDYVMFVDGDDFIHPQCVELFVNCAEKTGSKLVCADVDVVFTYDISFDKNNDVSFQLVNADDLMLTNRVNGLMSSCCKLYSSDIVRNVRFDEKLIYSEDTIFLFNLFLDNQEIGIVNCVLYYYYHREGSATRTEFKIKKSNTLIGFSDLCDVLLSKKKYRMLDQMLVYMFKFILTVRTQSYGLDCFSEVNNLCNSIGKKWINRIRESDNLTKKEKIEFVLFFYSRPLYEIARLITDPTMLDFYKNRRKHNGDSRKD